MKKSLKKVKVLSSNLFPVVGIGASAGGLDAFKKLLKAIPDDSGMAYVLVQHLDPKHESLLADLLQKVTNIPVLEIADDMRVEPNHIYVIPSNKMMVANDGVLQLTARPIKIKNERNLPIDLFFTSLAEVYQSHAIGVVLSGTATDGTFGLKAIKDHGGITFAQDEESAAYDGMPNSAVHAGVVDFILSPEKIPQKIIELNQHINGNGHEALTSVDPNEDFYRQIISLLRIRKGTDFTYYKKNTVRRRILRRMALSKTPDTTGYLKYLRENKSEQDVLYQDLLIPVTSFFRDQASFDNLTKIAFPAIAKHKAPGEPIRVWVAGCSTGEEAYSMAICLREYFAGTDQQLQIFATDINEQCIAKARTGIYTKKEVEKLAPQQLKEFFTKTNGSFQINKSIRDTFVFAVHNFLKDPPFGKMDLISCRNVFIYMEPYLQKKALTTFHYALNVKGFLLLGKSETVSSVTDLFSSSGKTDKLFNRKDVPGKSMHTAGRRTEKDLTDLNTNLKSDTPRTDFQKTADDIILTKYTPVGVVVNEAMDIVHFRGSTGNYLELAPGKPSYQVLKMAKQGLAFELRNLLHKAKKENKPVSKDNIPFKISGQEVAISIEAIPLPNIVEPHYLILFHDASLTPTSKSKSTHAKSSKGKRGEKDIRIEQLSQEIAQTHEDMRSITEDQEAANEELQSANEELLSSSEESQSLNEELESSKEELQSTNEELIVVNQELLNLNEHVTEAKNYAEAIIATIREPLLVLDKNLRVKTANQSYYKYFRTQQTEVEGKLIYELDNNQWDIPALRNLLETILPQKTVFNDFEINQAFSTIGDRILLLNGRELTKPNSSEKLILLAIKDITERVIANNKSVADHLTREKELEEKVQQRTAELKKTVELLRLKNEEKEKRADELVVANNELAFQNKEKEKRAAELSIANKELAFQSEEKEKRADELIIANKELSFQNEEKEKRAAELVIANTELVFQNQEKAKRAAELLTANTELVFQNAEKEKRGSELIIANQELESFTYVASHDLQEPLRKIQTFAKMIIEKEATGLSENGKDYFERMGKAAKRMQILIDDLLAYSQANTKAQKFERTDLTQLTEEVIHDFKEAIDDKKATIKVSPLGEANIIPFQFRQLMQNLIGNAIKFAGTGRPLHIGIQSNIAVGSTLSQGNTGLPKGKLVANETYHHISISDNGIGFEPKFKDKIFDLFQRLHGKANYTGTGIGLAIVKKIVENHHGMITATGETGKGATFDIYLPELIEVSRQ